MRKSISFMLCLFFVIFQTDSSFGMRNQRQRERTAYKKPRILRGHGRGVVIGIASITLIGVYAKTRKMRMGFRGKIWDPLEHKNKGTALAVARAFKRFLLEICPAHYYNEEMRLALGPVKGSAATPQRRISIGPKTVRE